MGNLQVSLFGRLCVHCGNHVTEIEPHKAQELFAYLLIYRDRPHFREKLATMLWPNSSQSQSKGYLRQTLWQLQTAIGADNNLLLLESDWIQIDPGAGFWLDVACFEQAYSDAQGRLGKELDKCQRESLEEAVSMYQADLLENWYLDWCLFERERLQNMNLTMLGKLVGYHEAHRQYETAISYASQILRWDQAHERTYRRMMRLHYLAGNRSGALRTYNRCREALGEGLGVLPSRQTTAVFEQIRADHLPDDSTPRPLPADRSTLHNHLDHLVRLRNTLSEAQQQLDREIKAIRLALRRQA